MSRYIENRWYNKFRKVPPNVVAVGWPEYVVPSNFPLALNTDPFRPLPAIELLN